MSSKFLVAIETSISSLNSYNEVILKLIKEERSNNLNELYIIYYIKIFKNIK